MMVTYLAGGSRDVAFLLKAGVAPINMPARTAAVAPPIIPKFRTFCEVMVLDRLKAHGDC
jgi:hypothetical protein